MDPPRSAFQTFLATSRARRDVANSGHMGAISLMVRVPTALGDWKRRIGKIAVKGGNDLSTLTNRPADALD
jgi:hypothetical protein